MTRWCGARASVEHFLSPVFDVVGRVEFCGVSLTPTPLTQFSAAAVGRFTDWLQVWHLLLVPAAVPVCVRHRTLGR